MPALLLTLNRPGQPIARRGIVRIAGPDPAEEAHRTGIVAASPVLLSQA